MIATAVEMCPAITPVSHRVRPRGIDRLVSVTGLAMLRFARDHAQVRAQRETIRASSMPSVAEYHELVRQAERLRDEMRAQAAYYHQMR
ncbi:hypothetical protein FB562_0827 [Homoserinimonas aerilata]|uniref:Uncharacterized protein n=1 Tax=Homoserinimonas aerilata TaxID=1162970 RepID=A0A542YI39_9MICO|nr:hypothetical protein [Homoserinimonas aerilata]TQL47757.1 hypothetical protein FB562_0827 [Homoserinimonas aerilata]